MQEQTSSNSLGERVPKLRFLEFEGEWVCEKLSDFTERVTRKNTNNETELPLTISSKDGLVDQISYFNKTVASKDMSGYYLLKRGEYAYNKSYSVGYSFGSIKRLDRYAMGALSTLYICFTLKKHNTDFVNTYFDSLKWYHEIHMISAEGARNHGLLNVSTEAFFETKHWLPKNIDEQEKIAKFFQLLEYRIEIQQKLLDALKLYKRGLLSKLFPQKGESVPHYRFTGFMDAWEQRKFGEITELKSASRVHKEEWTTEGVPFYRSSDVMAAINGTENDKAFISQELYEKLSSASGRLEAGDILVTGGGSVGNPYIVPDNAPLYTKDADLLWIKNQGRFNSYFVYEFFLSPSFRSYLGSISHVGTIAHYTITQLSETPISLPSVEEQDKLGKYFQRIDHLITLHQRKYNSYKKEKLALLQQMFI